MTNGGNIHAAVVAAVAAAATSPSNRRPPRPSPHPCRRIRGLIPYCCAAIVLSGGRTVNHPIRENGAPAFDAPLVGAAALAVPSPVGNPTGFCRRGRFGDVRCGATTSGKSARWIDLTDSTDRVVPPRSGHVAFRVPSGPGGGDDDTFVFGGYAEDQAPDDPSVPPNRYVVNDFWRWSSSSPVGWVKTESRSAPPPRLASAVANCGDSPTLFGGWDPQTPGTGGIILDTVHQLVDADPKSMEWKELEGVKIPDGPTSRHVAVPITSEGDDVAARVLVHNHRCTDHVLLFSQTPSSAMIKQPTKGNSPSPRGLHVAASLNGGRHVVVFGGAAQSGEMTNDSFLLDVNNWTWRELKCSGGGPTPRAGACACPTGDGNSMLVFGGAERAPGGEGLVARGDLWLLRVTDFEAAEAGWELLVDDDDGGGGDVVRPPRRNAATLTPIDRPEGEGGEGADAEYFILQGGWDPFKVTFNDNYVLCISSP